MAKKTKADATPKLTKIQPYSKRNRKPVAERLKSITSTIHRKRRNAARYVPH